MGYRIKEMRMAKKMSQEELAQKSGISRVAISNIETGKATEIRVGNLKKIAEALDCSITDLMQD